MSTYKEDAERHLEIARDMIKKIPACADDFLFELNQLEKEFRAVEYDPVKCGEYRDKFQDFQIKMITGAVKHAGPDGKIYDDKGRLIAEYKFKDK